MNSKEFIFFLLPLISCGEGAEYCTEMGCMDGLQINFTPALTTAGTYVFTATLDGVTESCQYTIPFVEENGEYGSCDGENLQLTISGTALDESEHSIPEMYIPSSPTDVSIVITRDEVEIANQSFQPEYEEFAPNGKECGPVCYSTSQTIDVSE